MQQAIAQGKTVSGLELGRSGTFTLRVVYPWKVHGELIGYIELGQEYDRILQDLKIVSLIDFAVVLDKKNLNREAWNEGMAILGRKADWDFLPDRVVIDQTLSMPASVFGTLFAAETDTKRSGIKLDVKGRTYRAKSFPMQDDAHHNVGEFVIFSDMTADVSSYREFVAQVVSFSIVLCIGLFAYSFKVLDRVDKRLLEYREQLEREFEKQAATNRQLEIEITERRRAEENLVVLNEHLELRVLDRTSELQQLNRQNEAGRSELEEAYRNLQTQQTTILQQDRMACIGQLAASVAHDINNPIGFVAGNLEVLKNYWGKLAAFVAIQQDSLRACATPELLSQVAERRQALKVDSLLEQYDSVLDESLEGTARVNRIVLNLKGFSRQDQKEARLANIHDCLESTLNIVMNELRYKADIIKEYGDIPPLLCYPQQLDQVFMNLLINASQAIEVWGKITIRTWADQDNIYVAIADTGCGISTENLPKLFEPFYTSKEVGVGTGLGLPIVRDIVKIHHGEITVESVPGSGSVFTVRLPLGVSPQESGHA
jgi:signal transduction histidine kinase